LFDKIVGDQYTFDECILRSNPSNVDVSEGEDTFNVLVNTNCSSPNFLHKPPTDA
jgi:hypothetical protein